MATSQTVTENARSGRNGSLTYDAIVIGSGQGGGPLAGAFAKAGKRVALIEREHVGGTCVNVGCTPTKTMVASAEMAARARRSGEYGVETGRVTVNMQRVRERKQSIVESFRNGSRNSLERIDGLDLIFGNARFADRRTVEVDVDGRAITLEAETVIINVGARPLIPPIEGVDETDYLDSTTVMELTEVPGRLLVVGGGYVGVEFAQMFHRFGSKVTILQRPDQLLVGEDPDVVDSLTEVLRKDGIEVLTGAEAVSVRRSSAGVDLTARVGDDERRFEADELLLATGRQPNSDDLGLDEAEVHVDEDGFVLVDEQLRTTAEGVWALGDVHGGPAFTHMSYDDYRIVRDRLLRGEERSTAGRLVPYVVYTDPQLGRVGLTERQARASGKRVGVAKMPASRAARSVETGNTRGLWKAVVDLDTDEILGAAILGEEGGEVMSVIQVAMLGKLPYQALRDGVFAHPTYAESLNNLFSTIETNVEENATRASAKSAV